MILAEQMVWAAVYAREWEKAQKLTMTSFEDKMFKAVSAAGEAVDNLRRGYQRHLEEKNTPPHRVLAPSEEKHWREMLGK